MEATLQRVVGKGTSFVTEDAQYRQLVVQPGWETLPLPIRAMMGEVYAWEELFRILATDL